MYGPTEQCNTDMADAGMEQDVERRVEQLLECLTSEKLARRMAEMARLAVAEEMLQAIREMQSAVEAEDSTQ